MTTPDNFSTDLIHDYLQGRIDDNDPRLIEALKDEAFRDALVHEAQLVDALDEIERQRILDHLKSLDSGQAQEAEPKYFANIWLRYAAAFVFIIGALFLIRQMGLNNQTDFAELLDTYHTMYPADVVQRGEGSTINSVYVRAMQAYANEDYEQAIVYFDQIPYRAEKIDMHKANALIATGRYAAARDKLLGLQESQDVLIAQNAHWYILMTYLGEENKSEAEKFLTYILDDPTHLFYDKAKELDKEL